MGKPVKRAPAVCLSLAVLLAAGAAASRFGGPTAVAKTETRSSSARAAVSASSSAPVGGENAQKSESDEPSSSSGKTLPVKNIQQLPELKAGCEVTSAAIVLNYLGYNIGKTGLAGYLNTDHNFITRNGGLYGPDPWISFVGSPMTDRYGCYAPVIVNMANGYLRSVNSERKAVDLTGTAPSELYSYIDEGLPVIVWATVDMEKPSPGPEWNLNDTGESFQWLLGEHCLVLIGYTDGTAVFSDPLDERGTVTYDRSLFEKRYAQLYSQAVLIR